MPLGKYQEPCTDARTGQVTLRILGLPTGTTAVALNIMTDHPTQDRRAAVAGPPIEMPGKSRGATVKPYDLSEPGDKIGRLLRDQAAVLSLCFTGDMSTEGPVKGWQMPRQEPNRAGKRGVGKARTQVYPVPRYQHRIRGPFPVGEGLLLWPRVAKCVAGKPRGVAWKPRSGGTHGDDRAWLRSRGRYRRRSGFLRIEKLTLRSM